MIAEEMQRKIEALSRRCRQREEEVQRSLRLTPGEFAALRIMPDEAGLTCREISSRLFLSNSRGSRIIDRLHVRGWVERRELPSDRRSKEIRLTSKGAGIKSRIEIRMGECAGRLEAGLTRERRQAVESALESLLEIY